MKKFAVINGATGGMGSAIALHLAQQYNLILLGRDESRLKQLAEKIRKQYSETTVEYYLMEANNSATLTEITISLTEKNYTIDALINCVGVVPVGGILDISDDEWEKTFNISFMAAVKLVRAFVPLMKANGGSIILINGLFAIQPDPNFIVSAAVTGALRNFAKAISKDLIQYGIRVNSLLPGATQTKLWDTIATQLGEKMQLAAETLTENVAESNPLKRLASPEDIAHTVKFLCSPQASYINGSSLTLDGGASVAM